MQLSARFVALLSVVAAATAMPAFEMAAEGGGKLTPELEAAQAGVQRQIPKMLSTLDAAQKDDPDAEAIKRVQQAFGPNGVSKIDTIRKNIKSLDSLKMQVSSKKPEQLGAINANTPFQYRESADHDLHVGPVEFGQNFYHMSPTASDAVKEERQKQNVATVLHEATHYAPFHASDDYYKDSKQMVPLGLHGVDPATVKANGGYANKAPVVAMEGNAINEGRFVKSFKDLKKEGDTENNADSYAVFGAACDAAMARLRKRALMEGDHFAYHLAKRGAAACKLPADHFAKKAAAKAAKEKAVGITPASHKTVKGEKGLGTGRGGTKALGNAAKSTVQKTSKSGLGKGTAVKGSKSKLSPKTAKSSRTKASMSKTSKARSKSGLTKSGSGSKKAAKAIGKTAGRLALSKVKGGKALSKASGLSKAKGGKSLSKASKGLTSMGGKTSKTRTPAGRSSSKKGASGASGNRTGARGGKQASKSSSKLTGSGSKAKSSKATLASRNQTGGRSKDVRTKESSSSQRTSKVPTISKQVAKAVSKTVAKQAVSNAVSNPGVPPKKKGGKS